MPEPRIRPRSVWRFDDPDASLAAFETLAAEAQDATLAALCRTQVARAHGLAGRFDEGHAVLDGLDGAHDAELAARIELERGRLLRSADRVAEAAPHFTAAADTAREAGLEELHVDALHMLAIVADGDESARRHEAALAVAAAASDPEARAWRASLLNNLGMAHADAGDFASALPLFEQALGARVEAGDPVTIRVGRWMVAWTLRNLGRRDEALAMQRALHAEFTSLGLDDPYVREELELLGEPAIPA